MKINFIKKENLPEEVKEITNKLEEIKNAPRSPEYLAMMDAHHKEWMEIAENAGPWEWSYGLDAFIEHLKWMRDYYKLGENVWAAEENEDKRYKKVPTRLQTIEKTLYYYDKWQNAENDFIKIVEHPETYKSREEPDGTIVIEDLGYHWEYKYKSIKRTYKKIAKVQNKNKKLFYKMLYKYMESWWD